MHISDIEGEYIPRKGDRVRYQTCPMPPRFDKPQVRKIQGQFFNIWHWKELSFHIFLTFHIQFIIVCFQAVHIQIIDFTPEIHHRWTDKETPEELAEDAKAIKEEQEMNDRLKQTPPHRRISGNFCIVIYR